MHRRIPDIFRPAEHNGTFRGNQLSFIGGTAGINYFVDHKLDEEVQKKAAIVEKFIQEEILPLDERLSYRGMGLMWGIDFTEIDPALALKAVHEGFDRHLIMEVAGRKDAVLKLMPPLTIEEDVLREGLAIVKASVEAVLN